ncbi:MAG: hypothetical protein U5N55_12645 [Cypionkella sp.]|nr:hypothetical protein [Cypionkella sp.]
MDTFSALPIVASVILANFLSFAFFMAAMKASQLQKAGAKDDQLPLWVYAGLIAAPSLAAFGFYFLH